MKFARGGRKSDINLNFVSRLKMSEPQFDLKGGIKKEIGENMWD
jgi:hypothetical protein